MRSCVANQRPTRGPLTQRCKGLFEIRWKRSVELHPTARTRMSQGQFARVQELALRSVTGQLGNALHGAFTIQGITQDGEAKVLKVYANLMSTARMKCRFNKRGSAKPFQQPIARPRKAGTRLHGYRHSTSMTRMPRNRRL